MNSPAFPMIPAKSTKHLAISVGAGLLGILLVFIGISVSECKDNKHLELHCTSFLVWVGVLIMLGAFLLFHYAGIAAFGLWWFFM